MANSFFSFLAFLMAADMEIFHCFVLKDKEVIVNENIYDFVFDSLNRAEDMYENITVLEDWKEDIDPFAKECLLYTKQALFSVMIEKQLKGQITFDMYQLGVYPLLTGFHAYISYLRVKLAKYSEHPFSLLFVYCLDSNICEDLYVSYRNWLGQKDVGVVIKAISNQAPAIIPSVEGKVELIILSELGEKEHHVVNGLPEGISCCEINYNPNKNSSDKRFYLKMW